ncbi:hypothetical protein [Paraburkholderia sp. HD33-4]|uniref:hypothetical protein n=1 Tax=Paraburkholderia sp. HD33-4 TaxID=2883242 RepID=UPI001F35CD2E|nr:hypothetical protein [Paraburkholderia sp. HD33-4]
MLPTLPLANLLANKIDAARRFAAQIASTLVPTGNLTPMTSEVLCYGCMAGIAMPIHYGIAICDRGHMDNSPPPENQKLQVIQAPPHEPQWPACDTEDVPVTISRPGAKAVDCYNAAASALHVQASEADGVGSRRMFMFKKSWITGAPPCRGWRCQ